MLKTVLLVVAGLVAGLAIAFWLQPSSTPSRRGRSGERLDARRSAPTASRRPPTARLAALEDAFAAEVEQRVALEARVAELAAQLEALGERPRCARRARPSAAGGGPIPPSSSSMRVRRDAQRTPEERQRRVDRAADRGGVSRRIAPSGSTGARKSCACRRCKRNTRRGATDARRRRRSDERPRCERSSATPTTSAILHGDGPLDDASTSRTCSRARRPSARACSPATRSSRTAASACSTSRELNALTLEGTTRRVRRRRRSPRRPEPPARHAARADRHHGAAFAVRRRRLRALSLSFPLASGLTFLRLARMARFRSGLTPCRYKKSSGSSKRT